MSLAKVRIYNSAGLCTYHDWRLPSLRESLTLIKIDVPSPLIDSTFLVNTINGPYWSATTYPPIPNNAWDVDLTSGFPGPLLKSTSAYVRLVRGGPF